MPTQITAKDIYLWGDGTRISPFDIDSVAVLAFLKLYNLSDKVNIKPNSNHFISSNGKLPVLITTEGTQKHGFKSIQYQLYDYSAKNLSTESRFLNEGFLEYVDEKFQVITNYNFFIDKENYEGYTRGIFKELLPFPLQYTPPIEFKTRAYEICENCGISIDNAYDEDDSEELEQLREQERRLRETPILSKSQGSKLQTSLSEVLNKKNLLTNMKILDLFEEVIDTYVQIKSESKTQFLFNSENYTTSEIFFFSHCYANTIEPLENQFLKSYLQQKYPELLELTETFVKNSGIESSIRGSSKLTLLTALHNSVKSYI